MLGDIMFDQIANVEIIVQSNTCPEKPQGTWEGKKKDAPLAK